MPDENMAQVNVETEEDDDFGNFSTADNKPQLNGNHEQGIPSEDDDFGDFASSLEDSPQSEGREREINNEQSQEDNSKHPPEYASEHPSSNDDFGGFDSAASDQAEDDEILSTGRLTTGQSAENGSTDSVELQQEAAATASGSISNPDSAKDAVTPESSVDDYETAVEEEEGEEVDAFGDFGGAPSSIPPETPVEEEKSVGKGDEFGGFDSAADWEPIENLATEAVETELTNDESFGDFNSPPSNGDNVAASMPSLESKPSTESLGEPSNSTTDDNAATTPAQAQAQPSELNAEPGGAADIDESKPLEESFGAFNDPPSNEPPSVEALEKVPPKSTPCGDAFGDFDVVPDAQPVEADEVKPLEESFGSFNDPSNELRNDVPAAPAAPTTPEPTKNDDENDLGDFGSFDIAPATAEPLESAAIESKPTEDSFGDFNDTCAELKNDATPAPMPAATKEDEEDSGDFGGFDGAPTNGEPSESAPSESKPSEESFGDFNDTCAEPKNESVPIPAPTHEDEEDFGDFDGFDGAHTNGEPSESTPSESKPSEESFGEFNDHSSEPNSEAPGPLPTNEEEEHIGDFDTAPANVESPESAPIESKPTEESFGEFNDHSSEPKNEVPAPAQAQAPAPTNEEEEDFGDFDSAPANVEFPESVPIESKATEESFGDFNDSSAEPKNEAVPAPTTPDDDDFGDFGDFDSAPVSDASSVPSSTRSLQQQQSITSGFGASFVTQAASAPPAEESDPRLQKAKSVFSKVFEKFKLQASEERTSASSETVAVAALTASMSGEYDSKANEALVGQFRAIWNEVKREESSPVFIVTEGEVYSPNAHFSVRIDGDSLAGADVRTRQRSIVATHIPMTKPKAWKTAKASSTAEDSRSRPTPQLPQTGTMVQLPPERNNDAAAKKDASVGGQLSEKAQSFLRKIPDLSFMLETKLRLPSHAK